MRVIKCKSGNAFSANTDTNIDAEWKLEEAYYVAQGCVAITAKRVNLVECDCEHCQSLDHEFENLIESIRTNRNDIS